MRQSLLKCNPMGVWGVLSLLGLSFTSCGVHVEEKLKYLGQSTPDLKPQVFAPDSISTERYYEFGSVFNTLGTEFYYATGYNGVEVIRYSYLKGENWTKPVTLFSHEKYGFNDPFLSNDEKRLFFISQRPLDGRGELKDYDIWYMEKEGLNWSKPINAGENINSSGNEYYISFNRKGDMYFSSNRVNDDYDIYVSRWVDNVFQPAIRLGNAINSSHYEGDVFVDPDERYLIFSADRPDGFGEGDLYISFKQEDGEWTEAKNMGSAINTSSHELCPFVTKDEKFLFYTSNRDIYWVSSKVVDELE